MPVNLSPAPPNLITPIRYSQGRVTALLIQVNIIQLNRSVFQFIFLVFFFFVLFCFLFLNAIVADCNIMSCY